MKTLIITGTCLLIALSPYFLGRFQYNNANAVIQNLMDSDSFGSDSDIEQTLRVFNFDLTWDEQPRFNDYYTAGLKTIF